MINIFFNQHNLISMTPLVNYNEECRICLTSPSGKLAESNRIQCIYYGHMHQDSSGNASAHLICRECYLLPSSTEEPACQCLDNENHFYTEQFTFTTPRNLEAVPSSSVLDPTVERRTVLKSIKRVTKIFLRKIKNAASTCAETPGVKSIAGIFMIAVGSQLEYPTRSSTERAGIGLITYELGAMIHFIPAREELSILIQDASSEVLMGIGGLLAYNFFTNIRNSLIHLVNLPPHFIWILFLIPQSIIHPGYLTGNIVLNSSTQRLLRNFPWKCTQIIGKGTEYLGDLIESLGFTLKDNLPTPLPGQILHETGAIIRHVGESLPGNAFSFMNGYIYPIPNRVIDFVLNRLKHVTRECVNFMKDLTPYVVDSEIVEEPVPAEDAITITERTF